MSAIFISYRRDDASGHAGRLYDRLAMRFGAEQVFMDVDDIAPGEHFAQVIQRRIAAADVVLVVIGPHWLDDRDAAGARRLDDADDFVRQEVTLALLANRRVVPVLVGDAQLPRAEDLPAPLKPLLERQAVCLRDENFDQDATALTEFIRAAVPDPDAGVETAPAAARHRRNAFLAAGALVVAGALGFWWRGGHWPGDAVRQAESEAALSATAQVEQARFLGEWRADVHYPWGVTRTEIFAFHREGDAIAGTATFLGVPRPVLETHLEHGVLLFVVRTESEFDGRRQQLVHEYSAAHEVSMDGGRRIERLRVMMRTSRDAVPDVPIAFVAQRVDVPAQAPH